MKKFFITICVFNCLFFLLSAEKPSPLLGLDYLNKTEFFIYQNYVSTDVINADLSFSEYASYLQDSFRAIPFSSILYIQDFYHVGTGNLIFLFDDLNISTVLFQAIQNEQEFTRLVDIHKKSYGQPISSTQQTRSTKTIWETPTSTILLSHSVRPLGYTLQNMIIENPHPGFAFIELEGVNVAISMSIWRALREHNIIDINGLTITKNLEQNLDNLEQILSPIELPNISVQKLKVMLLSTTYGETNILYLTKNNSFMLNDTEDEEFDIMLQ